MIEMVKNKYLTLSNDDIKKLTEVFDSKVIIDKKNQIIFIKFNSIGYKIFCSSFDQLYYIIIVEFAEPINIITPVTYNTWTGKAILKFNAKTITELLEKINSNPLFFNIAYKPNSMYVSNYDTNLKLMIISKEKKYFSYSEYQKFFNWYKKNRVRILSIDESYYNSKDKKMIFKNQKKITDFFVKIDERKNQIDIINKKYLICYLV